MKDLPCMTEIPSHRFDYCRFGFDYQKPTRVFSNRTDLEEYTCMCPNKKHKYRIGITNPNKIYVGGEADVTTTVDRYRIPEELLRYIFSKHLS
jgi:hypothetical protein